MARSKASVELDIVRVNKGQVQFHLLGTTPLLINRMSEKAKRELLMPRKKTPADRALNLKHDPMQEFLDSPYKDYDPKGLTLLQGLATWFKGAICNAALDVPGANKSQIGRLCWVVGERVSVYGVPRLHMDVVRSADMNHTPDVRTRCVIPQWATTIVIEYTKPMLNDTAITNLLVSAGISQGVGDYRTGKGKGTYGTFEIVNANDPRYLTILKNGGRKVQEEAMKNPDFYNKDSEELFHWFMEELKRRGMEDRVASSGNGHAGKSRTKRVLNAK